MASNQLNPSSSFSQSSTLSLPTALTARKHLDSSKKSDTRNVHPGYSMFDWNRFCEKEHDPAGVGGQLISVSPEELAKHSTEEDAWTAVRGRVYNITPFMKFHPGGKKQLMRGAGNDCTELFDKIHVWVNSESILNKCLVGFYKGEQKKIGSSSNSLSPAIKTQGQAPPPSSDSGTDVVTIAVDVPVLSITDPIPDKITLEPTSSPAIGADVGESGSSNDDVRGDYTSIEVPKATNIPLSNIQSTPINEQVVKVTDPEAEFKVASSKILNLEQRVTTLEEELHSIISCSRPDTNEWGSRFWYVLTFAGLMMVPLVIAFMYKSKRS